MTTNARDFVGGFPGGRRAEFRLSDLGAAHLSYRPGRHPALAARQPPLAPALTWPHAFAWPGTHGPAGTGQGVIT